MSSQPYDGLPLNTPTVVADNGDVQTVATRTANGGTVTLVPHPGGPTDLANQAQANGAALQAKAAQALTGNIAYLALSTPTAAQVAAQVQALTRQVDALIRLAANQLAATDGT